MDSTPSVWRIGVKTLLIAITRWCSCAERQKFHMKKIDPLVMLLILTCLACGVLLALDHRPGTGVLNKSEAPAAGIPRKPDPLHAVSRHPGNQEAENTAPPMSVDGTAVTQDVNESVEELLREIPVRVSGLKNQTSTLYVAVFDAAAGFPKSEHSRATTTVPVDGNKEEFSLSLPVNRSTAIAVFQDLNDDGKLTKNGFGLPIEPYGFSNNARGLLGPPSFSQAMFKIDDSRDPEEYEEIDLR